ncbi:eukaryotic translation initiation factor 3 subunit H [Thraustotheca clavata]|uniref:Eukaryotic translation initiation factor 3 subunit H n=1 Tax=Thraustotheca clavata TaxID=74557 RepID=A0A1W0A1S4_9STRA|nr:eukaryotic translation initiation factor 3 subunit H [Thraustotheca clavata]
MSGNRIDRVQLEGVALLQIIKHCHENLPRSVTGSLLGLEADETLEITNSFPSPPAPMPTMPTSPTAKEKPMSFAYESNEYSMDMMKNLREVNMDNNKVGWYQSAMNSTFATTATIEYQFQYQKNLGDNAICIVYDPLETMKGTLSIKAYRLSETFQEQYKTQALKDIRSSNILEEIPIQLNNSEIAQCYLLELQKQSACEFDRLDLATNTYLENSLQNLSAWADELAQEHYKFQGYERAVAKQRTQIASWLQKRREENKIRQDNGEDLLPEEDPALFKPLNQPSRLESLLITKQMNTYCDNINRFAGKSFHKLFLADTLHKNE